MNREHRNRKELRVLGISFLFVCAVTLAFMVLWDEPIAWYFETQFDRGIRPLLGEITEATNSGVWFGLAVADIGASALMARRAADQEQCLKYLRYARAWMFMVASMAVAAALLNIVKFSIGRYRPRYMFNDDLSGFEPFGLALKMTTFPSGHAQSIWSAMIALCFLTPRFTPVYIAMALTVSATRFLTAVHFVSDVVMGSFLSIAIALLMRQWFERNGQSLHLGPS